MIDFSKETQATIEARMLDRVDNSLDKSDTSIIHTATAPAAWELEGVYMYLSQVQDNAFISTAVGEALDKKALERGVFRKSASCAIRKGRFNVQVPIGSRFSTINGSSTVNYAVTEYIDASAGYENYRLQCETAGIIGNSYTGNILLIGHVPGLDTALITDILMPGTEEESDDSLRSRYMDGLTEKAFAGNIASYRTEVLSINGIGAVQVYPAYQGGGTVLCSILDSNFDLATPELIAKVQDIICPPESGKNEPSANGYGIAPIGARATIRTGAALNVDISAKIQIQAGYNFEDIKSNIISAIDSYIQSVRKSWGSPIENYKIGYAANVYLSQVNFTMLGVPGVVNATNITLNGASEDIICTETSAEQQVPVLGVIDIVRS